MTFEEAVIKPHYSGILELLIKFDPIAGKLRPKSDPSKLRPKSDLIEEDGLCPLHLRYALMTEPKIHKHLLPKIQKFFGNNLDKLYKSDRPEIEPILIKGCIRSRQGLTNFLDKLLEMGIIEKTVYNKQNVRYKISPRYLGELYRLPALRKVEWWDGDKITQMEEEKFIINSQGRIDSLTVFGYFLGESMPIEDNREIQKCLRNIKKNARKILQIRCKNKQIKITKDEYVDKLKESIKEGENKLKDVIESSSLSLFYTGEMNYLIR